MKAYSALQDLARVTGVKINYNHATGEYIVTLAGGGPHGIFSHEDIREAIEMAYYKLHPDDKEFLDAIKREVTDGH